MKCTKSSNVPLIRTVCISCMVSVMLYSHSYAITSGASVAFQSKATEKFVVAWENDLHATALNADPRAEFAVVDGGNGFFALRSAQTGNYWTVEGNDADLKVLCNSPNLTESALFTWIENSDNTVSLRAKANSMYLSVVEDDTTMVPDYSHVPANYASSLVITPQMRLPFVARFFVVHASASEIGDQEKFSVASFGLKKQELTPTTSKVLSFLYSNLGKKTVCGIHNKEPNSEPLQYTDKMDSIAGVYPALWDDDFQFGDTDQMNRGTMINAGIGQWNKGAIISLLYHMCSPLTTESCTWTPGVGGSTTSGGVQISDKPNSTQWTQLITDGTALNDSLKKRLKNIAPWFQELQAQGIEVLFRPFHEMNQGFFWWGGNTGANGTARLFQIAHDYLADTLKITNIIWVWDVQDLDFTWSQYNPGSQYWDIMAVDVYSMGYTTQVYNNALDIAGTKPLGVGECYTIPTVAQLTAQPKWSYFSSWADGTTGDIKGVYNAANVLNLSKMPGWGITAAASAKSRSDVPELLRFNAASGLVQFTLAENGRVKISLHDASGRLVATLVDKDFDTAGPHTAIAACRMPASGVYFVKLTTRNHDSYQKISIMNF